MFIVLKKFYTKGGFPLCAETTRRKVATSQKLAEQFDVIT